MTAVKTYHPAVTPSRRAEWMLMRDCMDGEHAVKQRGELYLPKPSGFTSQADGGAAAYNAYRERAQFPELLAPSVAAMIGIIHGREIPIDIPDAMEYLWEDADGKGLPLEAFHRRITRELLVIGGYGILADLPESGGNPWLSGYARDTIINWDYNWFVLDETQMVRKGFIWEQLERYRLLTIDDVAYAQKLYEAGDEFGLNIEVRAPGGRVLERVPFVLGNALDLSPRVEAPPLIGVANAAKAIYQLSADYRHQLYMSGQETLVAIDGDAPSAVGAGVVHRMNSAGEKQADLKYVSPTCSGIEAHKTAMEDARHAAVMAGARLFEDTSSAQESGEAKKLRYASETATLVSVAQNSCALLERALRNIAMMMNLPEDSVTVEAPTDLMDRTMSPQDFAALFGVYERGGMSWETYFANGQRGGIFSPDDTAEEEQRRLDGPVSEETVA